MNSTKLNQTSFLVKFDSFTQYWVWNQFLLSIDTKINRNKFLQCLVSDDKNKKIYDMFFKNCDLNMENEEACCVGVINDNAHYWEEIVKNINENGVSYIREKAKLYLVTKKQISVEETQILLTYMLLDSRYAEFYLPGSNEKYIRSAIDGNRLNPIKDRRKIQENERQCRSRINIIREWLLLVGKYKAVSINNQKYSEMICPPSVKEFKIILSKYIKLIGLLDHSERYSLWNTRNKLVKELCVRLLKDKSKLEIQSATYRSLLIEALHKLVWKEIFNRYLKKNIKNGLLDISEYDLWLVSEYGYVVLGVDRRIQIHNRLRNAVNYESILYSAKINYRDHILHVLNCYYLGMNLMQSNAFSKVIGNNKNINVLRKWFVASLFHDIGYIMEALPTLMKKIKEYKSKNVAAILDELEECWEEQIKLLNQKIVLSEKIQYNKLEDVDHGLLSYLNLRRIFIEIDEERNKKDKNLEYYSDSLKAVLLHNMVNEQIDATIRPIACLLIIADELQEWYRPRLNNIDIIDAQLNMINSNNYIMQNARQICDKIEIDKKKVKGKIKVKIYYTDQNKNYFEPLKVLLWKIYNFERINNVNKIPLIIEMKIQKLTSKNQIRIGNPNESENTLSEFEILREFCTIHENGCVDENLYSYSDRSENEKPVLLYGPERNELYDTVKINLAKFPEQPKENPIIKANPSSFENELMEFKEAYCAKRNIKIPGRFSREFWAIRKNPMK